MVEEKININGEEYRRGQALIITHRFISDYEPYKDNVVKAIGYLRKKEIEDNNAVVYLSQLDLELTDKMDIWDFSKNDSKIHEEWITDIRKIFLK